MEYILSIANIEWLKREIGKAGLTYSHLQDDLIDHICCDVEYEMQKGLSFMKAYERVKARIGIGGLERIQEETLYLIDIKYRIMKNTMKTSGVIAPIIIAIGSLFKIEHWPGASILLVLGFFVLSFVFLPSAIYVSYKEISNRTRKWTHFMGFFGTFFVAIAFLFKIMHWPGSAIALILGFALIALVFLPMMMINKLREKEVTVPKYVFVIAFTGLMIYLAAFVCKAMHWPLAGILMLIGGILLVFVAFPLYTTAVYKEQKSITGSFVFLVVALIWFVVPTTLISLNVSHNVMASAYETGDLTRTDIQYLQERNSELYTELKDNPAASPVKNSADELFAYIQSVKIETGIKNQKNDRGHDLFPDENERENRMVDLIGKFEKEILAISSDTRYQALIQNTLKNKAESAGNPETLPFAINRLSYLQLNILLAEQTALLQLKHTQSSGI